MKRLLTLVVLVPALLVVGQALASEVTNVQLSYAEGSTVATINVEGAVRYTHQTEEAKDGKPFRVILDILAATHELGANNFMSLPACPVVSIRSSQYAVQPEAVVRVVFDMEGEQVYRVDSDNKSITLFFADKAKRSFTPWSSAGTVKAKAVPKAAPAKVAVAKVEPQPVQEKKSVEQLNKSIDNDRLASLESKPTPAAKTEVKSEQVAAKPVVEKKQLASKPEAEKPAPAKVVTKNPPKLSQSNSLYGPFAEAAPIEEAKPAPEKEKVVAKAPAKAQSKPVASPVVAKAPEKKAEKPAQVQAQQNKPESKPLATKEPEQKVEKSNQVADNSASTKKATSRFRRSAAESKKIKGTLVAEFPKRLVIKYKGTIHRDPFATLLDESKTYNNPVERQVPNVEGLKLVGVIEAGSKDNRALFEDNEGYGYILKTGDKVQKGYVLRVESDRVYFQIFEYGWSRTVALHLES